MDQVEEQHDYRFARKLERYFVRTIKGTQCADWIVPSPFFSSSYLSIPIQVADVLYLLHQLGVPTRGYERANAPED